MKRLSALLILALMLLGGIANAQTKKELQEMFTPMCNEIVNSIDDNSTMKGRLTIDKVEVKGNKPTQSVADARREIMDLFHNNQVTEYTVNFSSGALLYKVKGDNTVQKYALPSVDLFIMDVHENVVQYNNEHPDAQINYD